MGSTRGVRRSGRELARSARAKRDADSDVGNGIEKADTEKSAFQNTSSNRGSSGSEHQTNDSQDKLLSPHQVESVSNKLSLLCMGLFYVGCKIVNPETSKSAVVAKLLVDTGAESTWIDSSVLSRIGIEPRKKDLQFQMANGQIITRSVGYAILRVNKSETVDEVVFAQKGDLQLLGSRALEGLNLRVDSRGKKLVATGPTIVATAVPPHFGQLIRVPDRPSKVKGRNRGRVTKSTQVQPKATHSKKKR